LIGGEERQVARRRQGDRAAELQGVRAAENNVGVDRDRIGEIHAAWQRRFIDRVGALQRDEAGAERIVGTDPGDARAGVDKAAGDAGIVTCKQHIARA